MLGFLLGPIQVEPVVKLLEEPIKAVGFSARTSVRTVFRDIPRVLSRYLKHKKERGIPNLREPWAFLAKSEHFDVATMSWDYTVGDAVANHDAVPAGMVPFEMAAGPYAVFPVRPRFRFLLGWAIGRMKRHAIEEWFPASAYEPTGVDFEYNDKDLPGPRGVDLYFAIRART